MTYFKNCSTVEEVKKLFKVLAKENHPDLGGNVEVKKSINQEYSFAVAKLLAGGKLSSEEVENAILDSEAYRQAIEKISHLQGIIVEIVGTWIWVTGSTYPVKDVLKSAGFYFASKKVAWYFRTDENKVKNYGKKQSLDQIKAKYGSETLSYARKNSFQLS